MGIYKRADDHRRGKKTTKWGIYWGKSQRTKGPKAKVIDRAAGVNRACRQAKIIGALAKADVRSESLPVRLLIGPVANNWELNALAIPGTDHAPKPNEEDKRRNHAQ